MELVVHIDYLGNKYFYKDKEKKILHREDGPAIENVDGTKNFYIDGMWVTEEWYSKIFENWKDIKKNQS
jgi:hypothetical protein